MCGTLKRAEEERARGIRDEVSRKEQILIGAQATLNLLYEKEKRLTAGAAGECAV